MDLDKLTKGKKVYYKTPSAEGRMEVQKVLKDDNNSTWVQGFDWTKDKPIKVRPAQTFASKPRA